MRQRTLTKSYDFQGKGLHSGKYVHMRVLPSPVNTGIRFCRTDIGSDAIVEALACNVSTTARSTTICKGKACVSTIEHILSALTGMGIDNALIEVDGPEIPILDGSARLYVEAMAPDGYAEQDAERVWIEISEEIEYRNEKTGSFVRLVPADDPSYQVTIDFNSRVLGVQTVNWSPDVDYVSEIAPCRTFCFLHEIQTLATLGLVKGGDVENAIVIVEKPVSNFTLRRLAKVFGQPELDVTPQGYLSNLSLRFEDECGRHKLLDLIGDLRLSGGFLKAEISAYKPGHSVNTSTAKLIESKI